MNSYLIYRISFYLMLTVATMALSGDSTESRPFQFFPLLVGIAGFISFLAVDRRSIWALSRPLANLLAAMSVGVLYFEYRFDDNQLIRALGHWLIYLQLIQYFLPKTPTDDWFLFLLGLMQVLIGCVVSQSDRIGLWLFLWAMLAIWVLGQFFLQREAMRFLGSDSSAGPMVLYSRAVDPYAGLLDLPYVIATTRVLVTTLALGGLIFLTLPRQVGATRSQPGAPMARHLTGFDEEVSLGQFGEILENDTVVMTVEFTDSEGKTVRPPTEPLWRGVTLVRYERGRWRRQSHKVSQIYVGFPGIRRQQNLLRQRIKLEANDSETLFAIRPIRDASAGRAAPPYLNPMDGTLLRSDPRVGTYDYEVFSDPVPGGTQSGEEDPISSLAHTELLLSIPEELKSEFKRIAEPIVASIKGEGIEVKINRGPGLIEQEPEDVELARRKVTTARAIALESYLRDSGKFSYSLRMSMIDPDLDPVKDFLVNRREGHCEYFASALALLLRSIDIPARVVNGFKGGDWNELTQTMNVRQKYAHRWVEALVGTESDRRPVWITLDPTPSNERAASIAHVGGIVGNFRPLTDLIRHVWVFYIIGYDRDRQNRLLYAPMLQMVNWVKENYNQLVLIGRRGFARLFRFEDISALISWRGGGVTFLGLLLLVGFVAGSYRLILWLSRWLRGPVVSSASLTAGTLFYRRLTELLARVELERTPFETQSEFAARAARFLTGQGQTTQSVAEIPSEVVDAFYRVRFGQLELEPATLEELDTRLDELEACMKQN